MLALLEILQPAPEIVGVHFRRPIGAITPACRDPRQRPIFPAPATVGWLGRHLRKRLLFGQKLRLFTVPDIVLPVAGIGFSIYPSRP